MKALSSPARVYRVLGALAVLHSVALFGVFWQGEFGFRFEKLWVGLATLWFLWPLILVFHIGRAHRRFIFSILLATLLFLPSWQIYHFIAPVAFGMPMGVDLTPWRFYQYFIAYWTGRAEARADIQAGRLVVEEAGFGAGSAGRILQERYGIQSNATAGCIVDDRILGHLAGYNSVSLPEITRRFGPNVIEAAWEEAGELMKVERAREEQAARELAKSISIIPSDSRVTLESVSAYSYSAPLDQNLPEQALKKLVRAYEMLVVEAIPSKGSAFEFRINGKLTPTAAPQGETSASPSMPKDAYYKLYESVNGIADVRTSVGPVYVYLKFVARETP